MKRALLLAAALGACSEPGAATQSTRAAIVKGTDSDESQNATVLVMHYDALAAGGGAASGCTGTLLAPTLVLTARHCVSFTDDSAACDGKGNAVAGGKVMGDHVPAKIYVFGGTTRPDFLSGQFDPSRGTEILSTGATTLCDNDIALVVLDKPVSGADIAPIRLDANPASGEVVTVVGWGISDQENDPQTRQQRTGVVVESVGPTDRLGPSEFRVGEGTCSGDSGGPALSAEGAVLGALSRGGNGTNNIGADACLGGTNIFTSAAGHADFIRAGYARVGAEPWLEGQPKPEPPEPDAGTPVQPSAPPKDEDDGCNASSSSSSSRGALAAFTAAVLFFAGRRRNTAKMRKKHQAVAPSQND